MWVAIRSRNQRSWLITTTEPAKLRIASSRARSVSTSRSFVGSSRRSTLAPLLSMLALQDIAALIDVRQPHRLAQPQRPGVGFLLAADHPEQGRLAGAVRADDA